MCKFIGKSSEQILCKLSKSEILRLFSIIHAPVETMKMTNFTCQSKSFISIIFFTFQVSACELQPFSCHNLANAGLEIKKILKSPFGDQLEKNSRQMQSFSRQFVNDTVRASDISRGSQSLEIHKSTQNTAKFGRNLLKYISVQHV